MPAIDLARLRKQANRLADFFFLPDEFMKHLRQVLEYYVNYTLRTKERVAPGSNLRTYRTPAAVLTHIENELRQIAEDNPHFALELADRLWEEGALETRLLAAFLLGRIPPQEQRLISRLTAWTQQARDPDVRASLLSTSLARMRKEAPDQFLGLIREYLHAARKQTWSSGLQALLPMVADMAYENLPPIFDLIEPVIEAAPSTIQDELAAMIVELYRASPNETVFLLRNVLINSKNPMTSITLRRISPQFPPPLQVDLRDLLRPGMSQRAIPQPLEEKTPESNIQSPAATFHGGTVKTSTHSKKQPVGEARKRAGREKTVPSKTRQERSKSHKE